MARLLVMTERQVDAESRARYLQELKARRQLATASGANFWVFRQSDDDARFLECTEAGSESALMGANGGHTPLSPLWREVEDA